MFKLSVYIFFVNKCPVQLDFYEVINWNHYDMLSDFVIKKPDVPKVVPEP